MSLAQAVVAIADDMDKSYEENKNGPGLIPLLLKTFARELRIAVKAAGEQPASDGYIYSVNNSPRKPTDLVIPSHSNPGTGKSEEDGEQMVICLGGSFDGTAVPVSGCPIGAFIPVAEQEVYQLVKDAGGGVTLTFSARQTLRYQEQKGKQPPRADD